MKLSKILIHWYSANKRSMPWRHTVDPYKIWLSEIILQQTQVKQGLPYYEAFLESYPTIKHLAKADESDVLKLWQGLGYYSRARNLHKTAKIITNDLKGIFPNNYLDLIKLKGVGDYTASAIASICFNEPCAVVDGNVYRVLSRYFGIVTATNTAKGKKEFKQLAQKIQNKNKPAEHNQAIMEFGALLCKPKNPKCNICPLSKSCVALQKNQVDSLPVKLKTTKVTKRYFNFLVIIANDSKTILQKRVEKDIWQNLYQFPLIESDNSYTYSKIKDILDNYDMLNNIEYNLFLYNEKEIIHKLSHQHLHTKFWIINTDSEINNSIPFSSLRDFAVPILIGNFIEQFNF